MNYVDAATAPLIDNGQLRLHGKIAFDGMRKVGQVSARCLDALADIVQPGITTNEIDKFVYQFGVENGAIPATLGYRGFTKSCCTSINHVVCHGIPDDKVLKSGDIINIDVTYIVDGWHGDTSRMYAVGELKRSAERLIEVTYESLMIGIEAAKPGNTTGDIGAAIQKFVERERCSVVRDFCGHGLGQLFHDSPKILHYGNPGDGIELKPGMFFTIEPMVNLGRPNVKVKPDGWTAVTRDKSLSAQFEHSIGITEDGNEIFTQSPTGRHAPPYI